MGKKKSQKKKEKQTTPQQQQAETPSSSGVGQTSTTSHQEPERQQGSAQVPRDRGRGFERGRQQEQQFRPGSQVPQKSAWRAEQEQPPSTQTGPVQQQQRLPPGLTQPTQTPQAPQQRAWGKVQEQHPSPTQTVPAQQQQRLPSGFTQPPQALQQGAQKKGQQQQQPLSKKTVQVKPEEESKQQKQQQQKLPSSEKSKEIDLPIPWRQKLNSAGTNGRNITLETNHFALALSKLGTALHYDVTIDPDKPKKLMKVVMEAFRRKHYPTRYPAFDGVKNLITSKELPIQIPIEDEISVIEDDRTKTFKVTVKYAAKVDLSILSKYFASAGDRRQHADTPQTALQYLDIVLRNAPALSCVQVGRSFFTKPRTMVDLGEGMEMYYGFFQSAILGWKPFLNVDVSHKAFPKNANVVDIIYDLCPNLRNGESLQSSHVDTVNKFLKTLKVQYEIPGNAASKRVYRVNALDKPPAQVKFKTDNNQEITVMHYFSTIKGYNIRCPYLPCLWVGSRTREQKILLPPELCLVLEGQALNRTMTPAQTSAMIKVAATSTSIRKQKIQETMATASFNRDPYVREFGISVATDFTKVQGRVLDSPTLQYNAEIAKPERGVWRAKRFLTSKSLECWGILCLDLRTRPEVLQEFAVAMAKQGAQLGMNILQPRAVDKLKLSYNKENFELERQFRNYKGFELILVVIPDQRKDIYNYVKQVAELSIGTLTQCVQARNVFRPKPATVGNILLKVNAKLNGVNHILARNVMPKCLLQKPCMIMGADVTHPSPETRRTVPSVAAVTASHDIYASQYNIHWRLQSPTQEIIGDLTNIVKQHLLFFYKKNNRLKPESIIFFRDGVSEGQFQTVLNDEVKAIRKACLLLQADGNYKPKLTFLLVQKRHHTRFFPTNPRDSEDRNFNVPAGTVVDTEITHPTALDFYLVSHASIQGVARPTKYRMLWDENDMNEDELEKLTYHLCHMFTRCTRSVSYPAPTYYAHLAAARAKIYTERMNLNNMDNLEKEQEKLKVLPDIIEKMPMFFV